MTIDWAAHTRADNIGDWTRPDPELVAMVIEQREAALDVYDRDPVLKQEHLGQEDSFRTGGYATRQAYELVQNALDALHKGGRPGRIELRIADGALYCANQGAPFNARGLEAISHAYVSSKRGDEIGRFGLGFKSALGVTDQPQVFSRSISFAFNVACDIADVPATPGAPILRMPQLLDVEAAFAEDANLTDLARWATTIVKLPIVRRHAELFAQVAGFKAELALFAPFLARLAVVEKRGQEIVTRFDVEREELVDGKVVLRQGDGTAVTWRIASEMFTPSQEARADAGDAVYRDNTTVSYAVSDSNEYRVGEFWSFFPLQDRTTATGIFNAPWRTNDDRTTLMPGMYNRELLKRLGRLFLRIIPELSTTEDPARHFDYLPARGNEVRSWGDRILNEFIPNSARISPIVPNLNGELRIPEKLTAPRLKGERVEPAVRAFQQSGFSGVNTAHASCFTTRTRRTRLRELMGGDLTHAGQGELAPNRWLEQLIEKGGVDALKHVTAVVELLGDSDRKSALEARVVPDTKGHLHRLDAHRTLFLRSGSTPVSTLSYIDPRVLEVPGVEAFLRLLGYRDASPEAEIEGLGALDTTEWSLPEWEAFWARLRRVEGQRAARIVEELRTREQPVLLLTAAGSWKLAGELVHLGEGLPKDPDLRPDVESLGGLAKYLHTAGVVTRAHLEPMGLSVEEFTDYRIEVLRQVQSLAKSRVKKVDYGTPSLAAPVDLLRRLRQSGDNAGAAAWTSRLLMIEAPTAITITVHSDVRQKAEIESPYLWALRRWGVFTSSVGPVAAGDIVGETLTPFRSFLPVVDRTVTAKLSVPQTLDEVPASVLAAALGRSGEADAATVGLLLEACLKRLGEGSIPLEMIAVRGRLAAPVARDAIFVATSAEELAQLARAGVPHVFVRSDESARRLNSQLGLKLAADFYSTEIELTDVEEPIPALDRFRALRDYRNGELAALQIVRCKTIRRLVKTPDGTRAEPLVTHLEGDRLMVVADTNDEDLLVQISSAAGLGLNRQDVTKILRDQRNMALERQKQLAKAAESVPEKLLAISSREQLARNLPAGLLKALDPLAGPFTDLQIAEMYSDIFGFDALRNLKTELVEAGFEPPRNWDGKGDALGFVKELGFPTVYAGERTVTPPSVVQVIGRVELAPLHLYQSDLAIDIRRLLQERDGNGNRGRALLSLPTGGGKTRVAVEATIDAIVHEGLTGPVLWIAQTEELCEQAVVKWQEVWHAKGDQRLLSVCRLWGKQHEIDQIEDGVQIVVATDAKLEKRLENDAYGWLRDAAFVIIDEAHVAGGSNRYTKILRWLGIDSTRVARPLLGLTATPFKGRSEEQNNSLASRFGRRRIDIRKDDDYAFLQDSGFLSLIDHELLRGVNVTLSPEDVRATQQYGGIPQQVLERVGQDQNRTLALAKHISALVDSPQTLVFTPSVSSAHTLAGVLKVQGIRAAAVDGSTRRQERTRIVEEFRRKDIQVLVNCDLFTQGFDAPKVEALYVARPTFSPNRYIQMVGRGLRGSKNGGSERCLVVNVEDTFDQFGEKLAYREFDFLWTRQGGRS